MSAPPTAHGARGWLGPGPFEDGVTAERVPNDCVLCCWVPRPGGAAQGYLWHLKYRHGLCLAQVRGSHA